MRLCIYLESNSYQHNIQIQMLRGHASYAIEDETKCAQTQPDVTYEHESIHVRMIWHA